MKENLPPRKEYAIDHQHGKTRRSEAWRSPRDLRVTTAIRITITLACGADDARPHWSMLPMSQRAACHSAKV